MGLNLREWFAKLVGEGRTRSVALEVGLLFGFGMFMALIAPYGTDRAPTVFRIIYWLVAIVGGGLIGIGLDRLISARHAFGVRRSLIVALLITPLVTVIVAFLNWSMMDAPSVNVLDALLAGQVFIISFAFVGLRALVYRRVVVVERVVEPPLPDADAKFRRRLSARLRSARLFAIEAEDHYVRVHTDAGSELVTLRFSDALDELERVYGFRTHRSWWVVADAIEQVRWRKGAGDVHLVNGLVVPLSRSSIARLRSAGWT